MRATVIFKCLAIMLWLMCFGSMLVAGYVQDNVLKNNQRTLASAANPAKLKLKGREFNVTRQQKLLYENSDLVLFVAFPLGVLVYFVGGLGKKNYKALPPMQAVEGSSTLTTRSRPTPQAPPEPRP